MSKHSYEFVKKEIESNEGYRLLSEEYVNSISKLKIMCPKEHVFPMSYKVFRNGHRCSYCAGKRQYNIDEVRGFFEKEGYSLISEEYKSNRDKLEVIGPDENRYITDLFSFKVAGVRPHLKKVFKGEEECREIIQKLTGKRFEKVKPEWLENPETGGRLELDGYNDELKIAFEHDGRQHFSVMFSSKNGELQNIVKRDRIKDELCAKNGVKLIRIPFYIEDKKSYIDSKLNKNKHLYVGDPHVQICNLEDCKKLIKFIHDTAKGRGVSKIVFLGDLFHTHAVIRMEVWNFWVESIKKLKKQYDIVILCGNHDMILGESKYAGLNAVSLLRDSYNYNLNIIDTPAIIDSIAYIPYTHKHEFFLKNCQDLFDMGATEVLVAHQTFTGAAYENGFYAKDGIDPAIVPQKNIISGHIHKTQTIGKCFYPGTPKWDSMTDAGENKGVWVVSHGDKGEILEKEFISTDSVVTCYKKFKVLEGEEIPKLNPENKNYLELEGSNAWITSIKKKFKGVENLQIKAIPTDVKLSQEPNKEIKTINDFLKNGFKPVDGISIEEIQSVIEKVS